MRTDSVGVNVNNNNTTTTVQRKILLLVLFTQLNIYKFNNATTKQIMIIMQREQVAIIVNKSKSNKGTQKSCLFLSAATVRIFLKSNSWSSPKASLGFNVLARYGDGLIAR